MIKAGPAYDQRNEFEHRDDVARELANKYDKRANIVVPFGQKLSFTSVSGKLATLGMDGSDNFTISIDGGAGVSFATQASVTTVDGKLTASYGFTVDVNGRIASMKLLSNGSTSSVKFLATTFSVYNGTTDEAPFTVEGGVVKANKVLAGSVTATEISVSSLDAISATIGLLRTASTGARMELESNQGRVYDSSNTLRVRWGIWT